MLIVEGRHYENGEPVRIQIDGERIASIEPGWPTRGLARWPYVAPGLFDLQINGHGGIWFGKEGITADEVLGVLEAHFRFGVTRLCPTLITNSFEALAGGFAAIRKACERELWAERMVPGCHLEGPYISSEDGPRGAHPREFVRSPDWDEFLRLQQISGGRIRLVTLAPELPGAIDFISRAVTEGVVVSIGHTAANPQQIAAAVDAGARLSTHLGNGAHGMIRRHPNYIWEQLGDPRLSTSVIADGHHLPASVLRSILRTKSSRNVILTCDAAGLAGCPPVFTPKGPCGWKSSPTAGLSSPDSGSSSLDRGRTRGSAWSKPYGMRESPYRKPSIWPGATRPGCLGSRKFDCDAGRGPICFYSTFPIQARRLKSLRQWLRGLCSSERFRHLKSPSDGGSLSEPPISS